ncbi:FixH family protein [Cytobacillus massiliigabonensis]|uniref:FixH family protein n=1 Tax=Cytobacillus massiliigabonensis TaxID=1871011 RepID=UPI000C8335F8|nr:FixH family protein [Cytobacillus massiliigabonensis]
MRKLFSIMTLLLILLTGCSSGSNYEISIETPPTYNGESESPIIFKVSEDGKPVEGLEVVAYLEMAKMDHGEIHVEFQDKGSGLYESSVELPMAGEWIANIEVEKDGESFEEAIIFDVDEE